MNYIKNYNLKNIIKEALKEDIGTRDITTVTFIPKNKSARAILLAKENCVVCGINIAGAVFRQVDRKIKFLALVRNGRPVKKGRVLASIQGKARGILTAERTALNFLCLLSGIATKTRKFVEQAKPYKAKIIDTRKTIPTFRLLEKYAVRMGGGFNHRLSLDEMIMVKDNHIKIIGEVNKIILPRPRYAVEIEVKGLKEFKQALAFRPNIIMLDNMGIKDMKRAVQIRDILFPRLRGAPLLEASGGVTLNTVRKIASTGVDMISVGSLTHSPQSVDISLEII